MTEPPSLADKSHHRAHHEAREVLMLSHDELAALLSILTWCVGGVIGAWIQDRLTLR